MFNELHSAGITFFLRRGWSFLSLVTAALNRWSGRSQGKMFVRCLSGAVLYFLYNGISGDQKSGTISTYNYKNNYNYKIIHLFIVVQMCVFCFSQ